jgi:hypothetical protein
MVQGVQRFPALAGFKGFPPWRDSEVLGSRCGLTSRATSKAVRIRDVVNSSNL